MKKVKDLLTLALLMCKFSVHLLQYSSETTDLKTSLPPDGPYPAASAYLISPQIPDLPQITPNIQPVIAVLVMIINDLEPVLEAEWLHWHSAAFPQMHLFSTQVCNFTGKETFTGV